MNPSSPGQLSGIAHPEANDPTGSGRRFVFLDAAGKRWSHLRRAAWIGIVLFLIGGGLFLYSLLVTPPLRLPVDLRQLKQQLRGLRGWNTNTAVGSKSWQKFLDKKGGLLEAIAKQSKLRAGRVETGEIRAGFYVGWDAASFRSLIEHAGQLTHVCPEWFKVVDLSGEIQKSEDEKVEDFCQASGLTLMPLLTNLDDQWEPEAIENLAFGPPEGRERFIKSLVEELKAVRAGGVVIDWEQLDPGYRDELTAFIGQIADALHAGGMRLWLCVPMGSELDVMDLEKLAEKVDYFVATMHDENSETDAPGPVASQDWFEGWLRIALVYGSPQQWIVDLGNYGYDWAVGEKTATMLSFADVMSRAALAGVENIGVASPSYNPTFSYSESGVNHTVWFLDAVTFLNQLRAARASGVKGFAISRLGTEDPGVWRAFRLARKASLTQASLTGLAALPSGDMISSVGEGEVVSLDDSTSEGARDLSVGKDGRVQSTYKSFPGYPCLYREGGDHPHEVALTFDDGPDPEWTPRILEILRKRRVKATFFVIGQDAEAHPELVRRIVEEGHELGNHSYTHPNLALSSERQVELELNATQRLIQTITGRSTTLFRPPYNADGRPQDRQELFPIRIAQESNYLTVLENIDPEDWERPGADAILQRVKDLRAEGNIILLHDGGGNRAQTVEALPAILDYLDERGDRVVSLSELLGMTRDALMPFCEEGESVARVASSTGFRVLHAGQELLWGFITGALVLTATRTAVIVFLALRHARREVRAGVAPFTPPVSVLIPAYDEAAVIGATLRSVFETDYPSPVEVIVVDDGSTDETAKVVEAVAVRETRVRLVRQTNSGKAAALDRALREASHETVVLLDADTRFQRGTLGALVQPLSDPQNGAVSGHARVGNTARFIARCQALEYICGFNLDRRAYAAWNCITVVPGAVSAFRRQAINAAGGFNGDTLAEDTDLTLALHRAGYRVDYTSGAVALTEAPESCAALIRQRSRWAFGTMQCAWKHRDMMFKPRFKALGWFSLPGIWVFQVVIVAAAPLIDLFFLRALLGGDGAAILPFFAAFSAFDLTLSAVACALERQPLRRAWLILPMRFLYRPLLSWVIWKSIFRALKGVWVGWGKLERTASVPGEVTV